MWEKTVCYVGKGGQGLGLRVNQWEHSEDEDGGGRLLQSVGECLPDYMASLVKYSNLYTLSVVVPSY
jgi:hypothetical protein